MGGLSFLADLEAPALGGDSVFLALGLVCASQRRASSADVFGAFSRVGGPHLSFERALRGRASVDASRHRKAIYWLRRRRGLCCCRAHQQCGSLDSLWGGVTSSDYFGGRQRLVVWVALAMGRSTGRRARVLWARC